MTKRAALYARVSTARKAEHDLSIPDQIRADILYCQQPRWEIVAQYVDAGASATDDNRPEFQRMKDDAELGVPGFDFIVVHSYSRYFGDTSRPSIIAVAFGRLASRWSQLHRISARGRVPISLARLSA
jgi:hypothetical protein